MGLNYARFPNHSQAPVEEILRIFGPFAVCLLFAIISFSLLFRRKVGSALAVSVASFLSVIFFYTVLV